ncbi:hypothetical protein CFP56_024200 [Quercus suber]|uniref:Reticulon-like protein n=1 Tax=Quercus suber TaxID=58331 RepID=A0AAW0K5V0_QUESU
MGCLIISLHAFFRIMAANYIGAFCLTNLLLPLLRNSPVPSQIVNVTLDRKCLSCLWRFKVELVNALFWTCLGLIGGTLQGIKYLVLTVTWIYLEYTFSVERGTRTMNSSALSHNSKLAHEPWTTSCNLFMQS